MADSQYVPIGFKQTSDICLLSSYSFILGYYKKLNEGVQVDVNVHDVCKIYYSYFMNLINQRSELHNDRLLWEKEYSALLNPDQTIVNVSNYESFVFRTIHHYCQVYQNDNIRGYEHIRDFDEYLNNQGNPIRSKNFIVYGINAQRNSIPDAYNVVKNHLDSGTHHLAMVIYLTRGGGHSVVIFKNDEDSQYLFRDPNSQNIVNQASIINMNFSNHMEISEYILFSAI